MTDTDEILDRCAECGALAKFTIVAERHAIGLATGDELAAARQAAWAAAGAAALAAWAAAVAAALAAWAAAGAAAWAAWAAAWAAWAAAWAAAGAVALAAGAAAGAAQARYLLENVHPNFEARKAGV